MKFFKRLRCCQTAPDAIWCFFTKIHRGYPLENLHFLMFCWKKEPRVVMPLSLGLQPGWWRSVWRGRFFNWILAAFFGQWAQSTKRSDGFGAFRFPKGILPINITVELVLHYIIIIPFSIQVFVICKIHQKLKISYNFHHIYFFSIFSWSWLQTEYLAPDPVRGNVSQWTHNLILGSETTSGSKTQNLIPSFRAKSWRAFEAPIRPLWLQATTFDSEPAAASRL